MGTEQVQKLQIKRYYTDYVTHMIRFYLSTPETLKTEGKRKVDIENWVAVQSVWHRLGADDKKVLEQIFTITYRIPESVRVYCDKTGADYDSVGLLVKRTCAAIARNRGLI